MRNRNMRARSTHHHRNQRPVQYAPAPPVAAAPAAAAPAAPDLFDQLKRLGEFRDQGILTEEEFTEQNARILSA
jgi:hypothetical protein